MEHIRYKKETEVVTFQGKEITLENLSPVFTPDQEAAKRRELEQQLYEVFRKYADKRQKEEAEMCIRDRYMPHWLSSFLPAENVLHLSWHATDPVACPALL